MNDTKRNMYRLTLGASILLGLGILTLLNWLGARHYRRFDWTKSGLYSLSDKTTKVLKELKAPVAVTVFMVEGSPLYSETQELLRRYKAKSGLISVETLDPIRNRARAEALAKEFGLSRTGTVIFKSGDKKKYINDDQLADYDYSRVRMGGEPTIKTFKGEQEFTSAILSVTQTRAPKVLFTTGHGERKLDGRGRDGFALAEWLRRDNCTVEEWASLGAAAVPEGTDCIVVAAPRSAFTAPEADVLKKYLDGGGRALFFLDAEFGPGVSLAETGLKPLLEGYGVRVDDDVIVDPKNALPMMGPETFFAKSFRSHPITKILEDSAVVFPLARSIGVVEKPPAGATTTILVETSSDGWGETDLKNLETKVEKDDKDLKGPVPIAVAVESERVFAPNEPKKKMRLVVFGDADFASTGLVANAANLYLLTASANWALEREALVAIPPKNADLVAVTLSRRDIGWITLVTLVFLPLAAIALGIAVWMKRRS